MFISILFASCFFYTLCSGDTDVTHPTLGPIYPSSYNNSLLNFTILYPKNYQFDNLYVRFTIYDFSVNTTSDPQPYPFTWVNFTNSNYSLPWVPPNLYIPPMAYLIACFEWLQTTSSNQVVADTYECVVTRSPMNSVILPLANPITKFDKTNNNLTIQAYFPAELPYDQISITTNLDTKYTPIIINVTSQNSTYSKMSIFSFLNTNTDDNPCVYYNCSNSKINGSQISYTQCMMNSAVQLSHMIITKLIAFIMLFMYISM